jgi:carbonic anhydrase/acetyltransferase-like protein (isoleucine patch superfamily)
MNDYPAFRRKYCMALIKNVRGFSPIFGKNCYLAENATVIGDVVMGDDCSIWFNTVIRGDVNSIRIGNKVNIQDGAVIHATYKKSPTTIGNNVSIGHNAIVHGCTIQDNVLIGMGSIVMDDCLIESNSIIAAGAVVTKNTHVKSGSIYAGVPAKKIQDISQEMISGEINRIARNYVNYSRWFQE